MHLGLRKTYQAAVELAGVAGGTKYSLKLVSDGLGSDSKNAVALVKNKA